MIDWKTWGKRLLYPPVWLMILLTVLSTVGLIAIFVADWVEHPVAYAVYVLAFYTLSVLCLFFIQVFPGYYRRAKEKFYAHPYGRLYMTDLGYKVRVSLYLSLGINLIYSAFNLISGVLYRSLWMISVAVYYILLSVLRFSLLRYMRADKDNETRNLLAEYKRYRFTGILMLFINLTLSAIVLHSMIGDASSASSEVLVITSAAFTFYTVTMSVVDMIRYRRHESPVITAAKVVRFGSSLVSLLSLEISMLGTFGDDVTYSRIMTSATGGGVCVVVVAMSVYMIVHAGKEIKKLKRG